ncbi:hypothetical protein D9619_009259 [Psilocybe cf. subviscida]|uniref:Uncharacterized protein n=1 Tax=Psilocybe cf. subviscida TaxID=2480587 RepID=A0A8H5BU75_9AGAR|nr:hypothetical protein D9619_009259 [Psilocybe cf. subviscida]
MIPPGSPGYYVAPTLRCGYVATISASSGDCAKGPSSGLYLAIEFSRPRLLSNSILAMFNSKERLRRQMEATAELKMPSELLFGDGPVEGSNVDGSVTIESASDAA